MSVSYLKDTSVAEKGLNVYNTSTIFTYSDGRRQVQIWGALLPAFSLAIFFVEQI
jgi:hypothetical protein